MMTLLKSLTIVCACTLVFIFMKADVLEIPSVQEVAPVYLKNAWSNAKTTDAPILNLQDFISGREQLYKERHQRIRDSCRKIVVLPGPPLQDSYAKLMIDKKHYIYYRSIPKCGSTFLKGFLRNFAKEGENETNEMVGSDNLVRMDQLTNSEVSFLLEEGRSFMFVREPYSRLLSAYVNKLYLPTFSFWRNISREVIMTVRKNYNPEVYKDYGFDITFAEFIEYILKKYDMGQDINPHFAPIYMLSNPCSIFYRYIGKLETYRDDIRFILYKLTGKDVTYFYDARRERSKIAKNRAGKVYGPSSSKVLRGLEFPFDKFVLRTWRELQLRGYVSKHLECPPRENMTHENYMDALQKAVDRSAKRTDVKQQRKEAFIQAYRQISMKNMERLRHFVRRDCMLFGYDDRPEELFNRTNYVIDDFNYLDGDSV